MTNADRLRAKVREIEHAWRLSTLTSATEDDATKDDAVYNGALRYINDRLRERMASLMDAISRGDVIAAALHGLEAGELHGNGMVLPSRHAQEPDARRGRKTIVSSSKGGEAKAEAQADAVAQRHAEWRSRLKAVHMKTPRRSYAKAVEGLAREIKISPKHLTRVTRDMKW